MADKDPLEDLLQDLNSSEDDLNQDIDSLDNDNSPNNDNNNNADNNNNGSDGTDNNNPADDNGSDGTNNNNPAGDNGNDGTNNNNPPGDNGTDNNNDNDDDEYYQTEVGISNAYAAPNKEPKPKGKTFSGGGKAPDRGKWKPYEGKGKLFMEVVYDEIIMAFIDWLMKKMVDIPLDFLDYVLFEAYKEVSGIDEPAKEDNKKKTILGHAADMEKGHKERAEKCVLGYKKAFKEVLDNIERNKTGEALEWHIWRGGEPLFFRNLVTLEEAAGRDPNSPEARIWNERILKSPEIFEGMWNNELAYRTIAIRLAAFEEVAKGEKFKLPKPVRKSLSKMEKIIKDAETPEKMKKSMREEITKVRRKVGGADFVSRSVSAKLDEMDALMNDPEADKKKLIVGFKGLIKDINDINPATERMEQAAAQYYNTIKHNIDKIREAYPNDTERRQAQTAQYINGMIENINDVQPTIIKYQDAGKLERIAKNATGKVADKVHMNIHIGRQKAVRGIELIKDSMDNFMVDGVAINERPDVDHSRRRGTPPSDRSSFLAHLSRRFGR